MTPGPDVTLAALATMPMEERCAVILVIGRDELTDAVRFLQQLNQPAYQRLTIERLAWAVASNITAEHVPKPGETARGKRCYLDYWPPDTPWLNVWRALSRPVANDEAEHTLLAELGASVACEHRDDWQPSAARPLDIQVAQLAFADVYERRAAKTLGYVWSHFRDRAGEPAHIAGEGWARVFIGYWSVQATKRVLGTSAISTLVCGTARLIACDALRRNGGRDDDLPADMGGDGVPRRPAGGPRAAPDQAERLAEAELTAHIQKCREGLPTRQQVAARLRWDYEIPQIEVAKRMNITAPAVSQLLEKARKHMENCLKSKGFNINRKRKN